MRQFILAAAALFLSATLLCSQSAPKVTGIDPESGKVGASVTVAGENIGKGTVVAIFLSDANTDFKASLIEQSPEKIVLKIPQVKPGRYNISIQVKNEIFIQPVHLTVEE